MLGQPSALSIGHCWVTKTDFLTEGKWFTPKPSLLHFSLPSQPRICNGRKEYTFPFSAEFIQPGPPRNNSSSTPQWPTSHSFPSRNTLNKIWPEKTVLHGRIPVQLQTSLPNCRKKLPQDGPICSHVRKFKGKCRAQGDLDYDCQSVCDCWMGR